MSDFLYSAGKIFLAARELATNPHDIKTRLIKAYNKYLILAYLGLDDDLKPYLDSISNKMTAKGREGPEGRWSSAASHTLYRMHGKTVKKIAEEIFQLHVEVEKRRWSKPSERSDTSDKIVQGHGLRLVAL